MLQQGSGNSREALRIAGDERLRLEHACLVPAHMLLGILQEPLSRGGRLLRESGIDVEDVRSLAGESPMTCHVESGKNGDQLSVAAHSVLQTARELGGGDFLSTHLLLGILDLFADPALRAFDKVGVNRVLLAVRSRGPFPRARDAHKGSFGSVLVVAGSRDFAGAAVLAGEGAGRGGAGIVRLAVPAGIATRVGRSRSSRIVIPLRETSSGGIAFTALEHICALAAESDSVVLGPGLGQSDSRRDLVMKLLDEVEAPVVVDADALNLLAQAGAAQLAARASEVILTPHPGEAARLLECGIAEVVADRDTAASKLCAVTDSVVALKGSGSVVTDGSLTWTNATGNPGLATGGSGDVLSGLLGAFLAGGADPLSATCLAVETHGRAGDIAAEKMGEMALLPEDILEALPRALQELFL